MTNAKGAGESGLSRLLELHFVATAADTLILTALATTIFFAVPTGEARGQVATSLLITMVPFVVLAPIIGPLLDRVPHGRRYAIAATMLARAWLAWVMAGAVTDPDGTALSLYPAALGFLVFQKAYLVTRAAAVPRVLPPAIGLVTANSRISMAGFVGMGLGAAVGIGLTSTAGADWTLRLAFLVFAAGVVPALALPARVDSSAGEERASITAEGGTADGRKANSEKAANPRRRSSTGPTGLWSVLTVAFVAGLGRSLGKLCLDALIQRDVPERVRTSAFARSESVIQLAWVAGGGAGLALPLSGPWGLGIAAVATLAAGVWLLKDRTTGQAR